jgi:hypothetical protein
MKILCTGFTLGQCGNPPKPGYAILSECLMPLLKDLGHDVDNRCVAVNEDLEQYDLIICGLISPFSVSAKYIFPAFSLLDRYWVTERKPVIAMIDDWEMHQVTQNSKSAFRNINRLLRPNVYARRPGYSWANSNEGTAAMMRVLSRFTETGIPQAIFPKMGFGDGEIYKRIVPAEGYWFLDPVSYMVRHSFTRVHPADRRREWVLAGIHDYRDFTADLAAKGATWPVRQFGGGLDTRRATLVHISEVVQAYTQSWGVLSKPYRKLFGAGWWRERVIHAAVTRNVLFSDPREMPQLGAAYSYSVAEIESFSAGQLYDLAEAQAAALRAGVWQPEQLQAAAEEMLATAIMRHEI